MYDQFKQYPISYIIFNKFSIPYSEIKQLDKLISNKQGVFTPITIFIKLEAFTLFESDKL